MEVLRYNDVFNIDLFQDQKLFLASTQGFVSIDLKSKNLIQRKLNIDYFGGVIFPYDDGSCQGMTREGITYLFENEQFTLLPYTIIAKNSRFKLVRVYSKDLENYRLIDEDNCVVWSMEKIASFIFLSDDYFYSSCKNNSLMTKQLIYNTGIKSINIENGNDIWVKNVPSKYDRLNEDNEKFPIFYGEINNLFGVVDGILWLSLLSGQLCGIDADTGDFIHEFGGLHLQSELRDIDKTIFEYGSTFLMKESKKVISITRNGFIEVDLNTLSMEVFPLDLPEAYDKKIIRNADLIDDDYLSFYNHQSSFYGIYNIKEKKVELIDTLRDDDGEEVALKRFRATEDYFFFLERHFYGVPERNGILKVIAR